MPDQDRPALRVEVGLGQRQRFLNPKPGTPQHHDQRAEPTPVPVLPGLAHHANDLVDRWGIGWVALPFVRWSVTSTVPGIAAGERRRPVASNNCC
ncbi:MAG: hypothetical protein ACYDHH_31610 [Solirubrobacteraceae bacterium]